MVKCSFNTDQNITLTLIDLHRFNGVDPLRIVYSRTICKILKKELEGIKIIRFSALCINHAFLVAMGTFLDFMISKHFM